MKKIGEIIGAIILTIVGFFINSTKKSRQEKAEKTLREDRELAEAIKRGDTKKVARIIKKNKRYKNL